MQRALLGVVTVLGGGAAAGLLWLDLGQGSEMMAALTSRMPPAPAEPGSPDDNG